MNIIIPPKNPQDSDSESQSSESQVSLDTAELTDVVALTKPPHTPVRAN